MRHEVLPERRKVLMFRWLGVDSETWMNFSNGFRRRDEPFIELCLGIIDGEKSFESKVTRALQNAA